MNFSVFDWNIQGTNYYTSVGFDKIAPVLEKTEADIYCFQEAEELMTKLADFDNLKQLYYIYPDGSQNRNLLLSRFPIVAGGDIVFPSLADKQSKSLENALWADIEIDGTIVRIYNCHFEIVGVGPKERAAQLQFVLTHAKNYAEPTIICGDLNTTIPSAGMKRKIVQWFHREPNESIVIDDRSFECDERYAFVKLAEKEGFREATDISKSTWSLAFGWELFRLKLDWFLVRNLVTSKVSLRDYVSDHRAIIAECSFGESVQ